MSKVITLPATYEPQLKDVVSFGNDQRVAMTITTNSTINWLKSLSNVGINKTLSDMEIWDRPVDILTIPSTFHPEMKKLLKSYANKTLGDLLENGMISQFHWVLSIDFDRTQAPVTLMISGDPLSIKSPTLPRDYLKGSFESSYIRQTFSDNTNKTVIIQKEVADMMTSTDFKLFDKNVWGRIGQGHDEDPVLQVPYDESIHTLAEIKKFIKRRNQALGKIDLSEKEGFSFIDDREVMGWDKPKIIARERKYKGETLGWFITLV